MRVSHSRHIFRQWLIVCSAKPLLDHVTHHVCAKAFTYTHHGDHHKGANKSHLASSRSSFTRDAHRGAQWALRSNGVTPFLWLWWPPCISPHTDMAWRDKIMWAFDRQQLVLLITRDWGAVYQQQNVTGEQDQVVDYSPSEATDWTSLKMMQTLKLKFWQRSLQSDSPPPPPTYSAKLLFDVSRLSQRSLLSLLSWSVAEWACCCYATNSWVTRIIIE